MAFRRGSSSSHQKNNASQGAHSAVKAATNSIRAEEIAALELVDQELNDAGAAGLAQAIKEVDKNHIDENIPASEKVHTRGIKLTKLDIRKNSISDRGAESLTDMLATNQTLAELSLSENNITDHGATLFASVLTCNKSLTVIDLDHNSIGVEGAIAIAEALQHNSSLTELNIGANKFGDDGASYFATAVKTNTTLRALYLYQSNITSRGTSLLAKALHSNRSITDLSLSRNRIGDKGAAALATALRFNSSITEIYLGSNRITSRGAASLAAAMKTNRTVVGMVLAGNLIDEDGAEALGKALCYNQALTEISLQGNAIGSLGAVSLASALKKNKVLKILYVGANNIGDEGAAALAAALKINRTLTHLNVGTNDLGDAGAAALANSLQTNRTLTTLSLDGNKVTKKYTDRITLYLNRNTGNKSWEEKLKVRQEEEENAKMTIFHLRAWEGDREGISATLSENVDLTEMLCSKGLTPLCYAALACHMGVVDALVKAGASLSYAPLSGLAEDFEFLKLYNEEELRRRRAIIKPEDVRTYAKELVTKYKDGNEFCLQEMRLLEAVALRLLADWQQCIWHSSFEAFDLLLEDESEEALLKAWGKIVKEIEEEEEDKDEGKEGHNSDNKLENLLRQIGIEVIADNLGVIQMKFKKTVHKGMKKKKAKEVLQWLADEWNARGLSPKLTQWVMKETVHYFVAEGKRRGWLVNRDAYPLNQLDERGLRTLERCLAPSLTRAILRLRPHTFPSLMSLCLNILKDAASIAREELSRNPHQGEKESPLQRLLDGLDGVHMASFREMCEGSFEFCELLTEYPEISRELDYRIDYHPALYPVDDDTEPGSARSTTIHAGEGEKEGELVPATEVHGLRELVKHQRKQLAEQSKELVEQRKLVEALCKRVLHLEKEYT